jgi:predicted metal-dependent peptidase
MASQSKKRAKEQQDVALRQFREGCQMVARHPVFAPMWEHAHVFRAEDIHRCPREGLAIVARNGYIYCNPKLRAEPDVWARVLAHCLLHLGLEHFQEKKSPLEWRVACDLVAEKFLADLKFGKPPYEHPLPPGIHTEERLYRRMTEDGIPPDHLGFGTAGDNPDLYLGEWDNDRWQRQPRSWAGALAAGLGAAVRGAVSVAAGAQDSLSALDPDKAMSLAARTKAWFISSYPLLGAIAASYKLIEDPLLCQRMEIRIAAVSPGLQEIYINPAAGLTEAECRFVMAHEFLHAALRHDARHAWRDAYLWNVACDYVINGWLTEMSLGERPEGLLYDEQFKGLNAEAVYDRIVTDLRTYRKLATLRGVGLGDILPGDARVGGDMDLDAFYRRALSQGLSYHQDQERGYLPEGLIEEIRALSHPPIPWDVALARWFDEQFEPLEKLRSYTRPSRRQSATPSIPRPSRVINLAALDGRTFGVVLDTSGSMERGLLAAALGAIASYSMSRDVPAARVVFCDAEAYDQGYLKPEDIAGTVKVKGRGGTVLQPGIDLLLRAEDFPKEAPVLIITDGYCEDRLMLGGREHAYLIPEGATLPFPAKGKVFRIR